jgi:hypothetical protein
MTLATLMLLMSLVTWMTLMLFISLMSKKTFSTDLKGALELSGDERTEGGLLSVR